MQNTVALSNGVEIPLLGLGVYQSAPGETTYNATKIALELGYRHIDTARAYRNEADVGRALRDSGVPRTEVFITTKLWTSDQGYDTTLRACEKSLKELQLDTVDLYLIHWPVEHKRKDSWRAMETLFAEGKCRAVGVSNYTIKHLDEVLQSAKIVPHVNQVEFNPFLNQKKLLAKCQQHGILLEAYAPLAQAQRMSHPVLVATAKKYGRTPAQIMLRWAVQQDIVVIPKSVRRERIEENGKIFDFTIDAADMAALDKLDEGLRTCWDPTTQN